MIFSDACRLRVLRISAGLAASTLVASRWRTGARIAIGLGDALSWDFLQRFLGNSAGRFSPIAEGCDSVCCVVMTFVADSGCC